MAATPPTVSPLFRHSLPLRFRRYYFIRFFILIYYAAFIFRHGFPILLPRRASAIAAAAITRHYADLLPICRLLTPPPLPSLSPPIARHYFRFSPLRHAYATPAFTPLFAATDATTPPLMPFCRHATPPAPRRFSLPYSLPIFPCRY
jgi:hypothetical protein